MSQTRASWLFVVAAVVAAWPVGLPAQNRNAPMARWWEPTNNLPNPWVGQVLSLPDGRNWGSHGRGRRRSDERYRLDYRSMRF